LLYTIVAVFPTAPRNPSCMKIKSRANATPNMLTIARVGWLIKLRSDIGVLRKTSINNAAKSFHGLRILANP
jgi:hypothetical protein